MHKPSDLAVVDFSSGSNPLNSLPSTPQQKYILSYLRSLGAAKALIEGNYFDRDYLSEFSVFYSLSSRGYPNLTTRVHFFSDDAVDRDLICSAMSNDETSIETLRSSYLGFTVLRPLPSSPFGRTVLKWFDDPDSNALPRVTTPSRSYKCHIGGIELKVSGLAWQQQDSGVAACATVSVWTMLHSSAFDDVHAVPTTADITQAAHKTASLGSRVFPSNHLSTYQLLEAIKEHGFAPVPSTGDLLNSNYFSKDRFSATCAAFLRSGYPVLILGNHLDSDTRVGHAVCGVGFREPTQQSPAEAHVSMYDSNADILYIHDDNIGPNVRFRVVERTIDGHSVATLVHEAPPYLDPSNSPELNYPTIAPHTIVAAVHQDLRVSPDGLAINAHNITNQIVNLLNTLLTLNKKPGTGALFSSRFIKLSDYLGRELYVTLSIEPELLGNVRLALTEKVAPMSLHISLIRIIADNGILMDILSDTTDTEKNRAVFAHVMYQKSIDTALSSIDQQLRTNTLGVPVIGYHS